MSKSAVFLLASACLLRAETRPMTLRQAVETALKQNPDIAELRPLVAAHRSVLHQLPTGAGKTAEVSEIVKLATGKNEAAVICGGVVSMRKLSRYWLE